MASELNERFRELCKRNLVPHHLIITNADQKSLIKLAALEAHRTSNIQSGTTWDNLAALYLWALEKPDAKRSKYLELRYEFCEQLKNSQPKQPERAPNNDVRATDEDRILDYVQVYPQQNLWTRFLEWFGSGGRIPLFGK